VKQAQRLPHHQWPTDHPYKTFFEWLTTMAIKPNITTIVFSRSISTNPAIVTLPNTLVIIENHNAQLIRAARSASERHNYRLALSFLNRLRIEEGHFEYYKGIYMMAKLFHTIKNLSVCLRYIAMIPKSHYTFTRAQLFAANILIAKQQWKAANSYLNNIAPNQEEYLDAQFLIINNLCKLKEFELAIKKFSSIPVTNSDCYYIYLETAQIISDYEPMWEEAINLLITIPDSYSDYHDAQFLLGELFAKINLHHQAIECYERIPDTHSDFWNAQLGLGNIYASHEHNLDVAISYLSDIPSDEKCYLSCQMLLIDLFFKKSDYQAAEKAQLYCLKQHTISGSFTDVLFALKSLRLIYCQTPSIDKLAFLNNELGKLHSCLGQKEVASMYFDNIPTTSNLYELAQFRSGILNHSIGNYRKALIHFQRISSQSPLFFSCLFAIIAAASSALESDQLNKTERTSLEGLKAASILNSMKCESTSRKRKGAVNDDVSLKRPALIRR